MFFIGDIHAESPLLKNFLESEETYCLQLGDFGFVFNYNDWKYNKFLNHFERDYPDKIIFTVLGNHENYDSINHFPTKEMFGAQCRKIRENIFAIERGEVLSIEGLNILCIGGADSTDKAWRVEVESSTGKRCWWPQERIQDKDVENATKNIFSKNIDMVCSHAMPQFFMDKCFVNPFSSPSEFSLEKIYCDAEMNGVHIPLWLGGHIHTAVYLEYNNTLFRAFDIGESVVYHKGDSFDKFR